VNQLVNKVPTELKREDENLKSQNCMYRRTNQWKDYIELALYNKFSDQPPSLTLAVKMI